MDLGASLVGSTNLAASCRYEGETWLQREDLEEGQAVAVAVAVAAAAAAAAAGGVVVVVVVVVVLAAVTPCILSSRLWQMARS